MNALVSFYSDNPDAGPTAAGAAIGVSRQTVYTYLSELEREGRIVRDNGSVTVLRQVD
jgi:DNA-binding IclR family transcriptional regulator